jgi:hypothetical protein
MLVKLIRPLFENGLNNIKLICTQNLSVSNVLFQQSYSDASSKSTDKTSNEKDKNVNHAESDNEQEKSQQEGPADRQAEQKSSDT